MAADLVLLAMGFIGPEREGLLTDLGVEFAERGNVRGGRVETSVPGVFVAATWDGPVADRVGDRRGSRGRGRGGPLPNGPHRAASSHQAHRSAAAISACAKSIQHR